MCEHIFILPLFNKEKRKIQEKNQPIKHANIQKQEATNNKVHIFGFIYGMTINRHNLSTITSQNSSHYLLKKIDWKKTKQTLEC
jgi:hypothetical protein